MKFFQSSKIKEGSTLKRCFVAFFEAGYKTAMHDGVEHAGYLSFLMLLALFPFLVVLVSIAGAFGQSEIGMEFMDLLLTNLPPNVGDALQPRIEEIVSGTPQGLMTLAIVGAIWTASSAVEGIRNILNRAYRVTTPPAFYFRRLLSIGQVIIIAFIIIIVMLLLVFFPILWKTIHEWLIQIGVDWDIINNFTFSVKWTYIVSITLLFMGVSSLYYVLPNIKQRLISVLPGALVVVIAWLASAMLFSMYLKRFNQVNVIYGSLGGFIVSLLFFFIINTIFIYGAELNYLLAHIFGQEIEEKEHAEEVIED